MSNQLWPRQWLQSTNFKRWFQTNFLVSKFTLDKLARRKELKPICVNNLNSNAKKLRKFQTLDLALSICSKSSQSYPKNSIQNKMLFTKLINQLKNFNFRINTWQSKFHSKVTLTISLNLFATSCWTICMHTLWM